MPFYRAFSESQRVFPKNFPEYSKQSKMWAAINWNVKIKLFSKCAIIRNLGSTSPSGEYNGMFVNWLLVIIYSKLGEISLHNILAQCDKMYKNEFVKTQVKTKYYK